MMSQSMHRFRSANRKRGSGTPPSQPRIDIPDTQLMEVDQAFSFTPTLLTGSGGTWTADVTQVPTGLSFNSSDGTISGTPTVTGIGAAELTYTQGTKYHTIMVPMYCHNGTVVTLNGSTTDDSSNAAASGTGTELDPWVYNDAIVLSGNDKAIYRLAGWFQFDRFAFWMRDTCVLDLNGYGVHFDYLSSQSNGLTNRGFESGDMTGWTCNGTHSVVTDGSPELLTASRPGDNSLSIDLVQSVAVRVSSTGNVTKVNGRTYDICFVMASAGESDPVSITVTCGADTGTASWDQYRGFKMARYSFTASEAGSFPIHIDLTATSRDGTVHLSHIDFAPQAISGIVSYSKNWAYPSEYRPSTGTGNGENCCVTNGTVLQVGRSTTKACCFQTAGSGTLGFQIADNVTMGKQSEHHRTTSHEYAYSDGFILNKCTFLKNPNHKSIDSRDSSHGACVFPFDSGSVTMRVQAVQGCTWNDFIINAYVGENISAKSPWFGPVFTSNYIYGDEASYYTNNFAVIPSRTTTDRGSVSFNTVTGPNGFCNSRGMRPHTNSDVFSNTVKCADPGLNAEYEGPSLGGVYAIQIEDSLDDVAFYDNTWGIGQKYGGGVLRVNGNLITGASITFNNETWLVDASDDFVRESVVGGGYGSVVKQDAHIIKFTVPTSGDFDLDVLSITNCTIITNRCLYVISSAFGDISVAGTGTLLFTDCTFTVGADPVQPIYVVERRNINHTGETWTDATSQSRMQAMYAASADISGTT